MKIYLFYLIIIIFLIIIKNKETEEYNNYIPNNIWMYWENKEGSTKAKYLELCYKTVLKHNSNNCKIVLLNQDTVYNYLPKMRKDLSQYLSIPQKTDYIRLLLLKTYGGLWLDSDIIVINNLYPILSKLKDYDYVGFGCHLKNCRKLSNGYPKPANWVMGSRQNGVLVSECLKKADLLLDNKPYLFKQNYHTLGRNLLWSCIDNLLKNNKQWNYFHFDSKCIERDSNGKKLINSRSLSKENIDQKCMDKFLFIPIYNTAPGFPKWFREMNTTELLSSDMLISKLFRKSLN